jgi:putative ABC transport system permease protein
MRSLLQDVRVAARSLRATPMVTIFVTLSMVLGIGASAAIFSRFFGGLALLLGGLSLYGVTAYEVTQQRTELGVRIALGATRRSVLHLLLNRVMIRIAAGVAIGLVASLWGARFAESLLYGLEPRDPLTLAGTALTLVVVAVSAAVIAAAKATGVDPAAVLREA